MHKTVSLIYVYFNSSKEIIDSIKSLKGALGKLTYEIIIVDNNSPKALPTSFFGKRNVKIIKNDENLGFGAAVNLGAKVAVGKYFFVINPDTVCIKNSINLLFNRISKDKKIGVIGPQQIDKNGRILHSTAGIPKFPDALFVYSRLNKLWPNNPYSRKYWSKDRDLNKEQETETIGGAAMMFPKKIFEEVGGFDERFFMYFEETDICQRIRKLGYKILYYPKAKIIHHVGRSTSDKKWIQKTFEESRLKYFKKYNSHLIALGMEVFIRLLNLSVKTGLLSFLFLILLLLLTIFLFRSSDLQIL